STDKIIEAVDGGVDTFAPGDNATLPDNVEKMIIGGFGLTEHGNGLDNRFTINTSGVTVYGEDGADTFVDHSGAKLFGGRGDDIYYSFSTDIHEGGDEGRDSVTNGADNYTLPANVEDLFFLGANSHVGYGNDGNNLLYGGLGQDWLYGLEGND